MSSALTEEAVIFNICF